MALRLNSDAVTGVTSPCILRILPFLLFTPGFACTVPEALWLLEKSVALFPYGILRFPPWNRRIQCHVSIHALAVAVSPFRRALFSAWQLAFVTTVICFCFMSGIISLTELPKGLEMRSNLRTRRFVGGLAVYAKPSKGWQIQ